VFEKINDEAREVEKPLDQITDPRSVMPAVVDLNNVGAALLLVLDVTLLLSIRIIVSTEL
jgi:hypothetical protein